MRVSLNWLKEYVEIDRSPAELAEGLTMQGLAVDEVLQPGAGIAGVVTGRVLEAVQHPNADRLRVCRVDVGAGDPRRIVCGAPNVAAGQTVPVALPGAALPGGVKIGKARLRGVDSEGMICSARELGIPDPSGGAGIMVLPGDLPLGRDFKEVMGLDDAILVLDLTPNYASHCQSMLGVAREVAALLDRPVRLPEADLTEGREPAADAVAVRIDAPDLCPRYVARIIRGVHIGPSPEWLRRKLEAAGMRSISNVVDVTNLVMLETGQPLHAFDEDKIRGRAIIVRRAAGGETLLNLDGVERRLTADDLVIADGAGAVALAGVMGGLASEVSDTTVNILLESAHFDPLAVRRTARRLGLRSEAAARFEKGTDPNGCRFAADRALALMRALAGGEVLTGAVDVYPRPIIPREILLRPERVNALLGIGLTAERMAVLLRRLDLGVTPVDGGALKVTVPTRRPDLENEVDLAEEVARLHGYHRISVTLPRSPAAPNPAGPEKAMIEAVRETCLAAGCQEVLTFSFTAPAVWDRLGLPAADPRRQAVPLANPLTEEQSVMRTCLLPLLLDAATHNARHRLTDVAVFEIGRIYRPKDLPLQELPEERLSLGIALTGQLVPATWRGPAREADFFALKGVVEAVLDRLGLADVVTFEAGEAPAFHPGRTAKLLLEDRALGVLGEIHPMVQAAWDLTGRAYLAELDLTALLADARTVRAYRPLPRFPAVDRDLAFLLPVATSASRAEQVIRQGAGPLLAGVVLFDVYQGEHVPEGWRSLAYSLVYQAPDRTLTDAEVEEAHSQVRRALHDELGATLRS